MDRKRFLELCQRSAVGEKVYVVYDGIDFKPVGYELAFDEKGNLLHSAVLKDKTKISYLKARLNRIEEKGGVNDDN